MAPGVHGLEREDKKRVLPEGIMGVTKEMPSQVSLGSWGIGSDPSERRLALRQKFPGFYKEDRPGWRLNSHSSASCSSASSSKGANTLVPQGLHP